MPFTNRANLLWLAAYLAALAMLIVGLVTARRQTIAALNTPAARAEWRAWRATVERENQSPGATVRRRTPKGHEPPTLVLMRDHFLAVLAVSILLATVLYGFVMFVAHGIASSRRTAAMRGHQPRPA